MVTIFKHMNYFNSITSFDQAKKQYRTLVKKMHPDVGGSVAEFQMMQAEYQDTLIKLKQEEINSGQSNFTMHDKNELLAELKNIGNILLKSKIPQQILEKKLKTSNSKFEKLLFSAIIERLNKMD